MEVDSKRKQVSLDQLNALIEFLKEHQELAKGFTRGRRGKLHTLKLWNLCAKKLNVFNGGAHKDGKGWSKYWCDWKYRVRRRALELKAAQDSNRALPEGSTSLTLMEESIMSIIGENSLEGVVIKTDPLGEEDTFEEPNNEDCDNVTSFHRCSVPESRHVKSRKRRHSPRDMADIMEMETQGDLSTPPDQKPRVNITIAEDTDDDNTAQFLQLEREKLDTSISIRDSLKTIASELTRLTDVMKQIKDVLVNKLNI